MRKLAPKLVTLLGLALAIAFLTPVRALADEEDPPSRVARLSHTDGNVSFNPAGTDDWVGAVVNRPMTTGDKLWADNGARAELHIGSASLRIGSTTGFSFLNLTDNVAQIQLTEGTLRVRVKRLDQDDTFEIDTPNLAFSVLRPGIYRITVNEAGDTTVVSVLGGEGEVTGGGQAYSVHANQTATFIGTDQLDADVQDFGGGYDDFDRWCSDRDRREDRSSSARYVSPDVIGYEDLDDYGGWRPTPEYGTVWFPHTTVVGWAPYRYGHWVYIAPWGYTWVEDEPWGFAPFHYGRWVTVGGVWGWVPAPAPVVGVVYVRPVYAPALVAWVGGPHFGIGVGVNVGWFPLGPREVYVPSYPVSRTYVNNVNITNTRVETTVVNNYYNNVVVNKQVNVNNVNYVNQHVNGAVTATSGATFTSGQSVSRNVVRVDQREVVSAQVRAPAIAPTRQAVVGAAPPANVRPPATFVNRAVVAKTAPPPPPPTFERQQAAIRENGGRPLAVAQMHQLQPATTQSAPQPNVRVAAPVRTVTPIQPRTNAAVPNQPNNNPNTNRPNTPANVPANANNRPANVPANANNRPVNAPPNASERPANVAPNANNRPVNVNPNANNPPPNERPANVPPNTNTRPPNAPNNVPGTVPGNVPPNNNQRPYNDRPASARPPTATPQDNSRIEQQHQQQLENLRKQQDLERQRVEQQQIKEQQRVQSQANTQRQQEIQQKQQQQLEQMERKHDTQQQQMQQRQDAQRQPQPSQQRQQPQPQPQQQRQQQPAQRQSNDKPPQGKPDNSKPKNERPNR
jgi:DNA segregation ATPase FtsK/SpoIIIE-like protein